VGPRNDLLEEVQIPLGNGTLEGYEIGISPHVVDERSDLSATCRRNSVLH